MSAAHALEHSEHIAHAGHGDRLGVYIGVTMAILGVVLAFCSAMVGSERTLLVQKLVEQQNAHAKYQAQDVKHRMSFLALTQVQATTFGGGNNNVSKEGVLSMARTVERYLAESVLAKEWTVSYDGVVKAHMEAQEEYEHALLAAEIGIVIASVALMIKRREAWYISVALGLAAVVIAGQTMVHVKHEVKESEHLIAAAETKYETTRKANKTTKIEDEFLTGVFTWAGGKPAAPAQAAPAEKKSH